MSNLSVIATSQIVSIQTGYVDTLGLSGSGEDSSSYADVTIAPVVVARSVVIPTRLSGGSADERLNVRLINSSTLRVSGVVTGGIARCRWQVVEYL